MLFLVIIFCNIFYLGFGYRGRFGSNSSRGGRGVYRYCRGSRGRYCAYRGIDFFYVYLVFRGRGYVGEDCIELEG